MALIEKLKNIANAIRSKTNKSEEMTLEQMASEVSNIYSPKAEEVREVTIENNGISTINPSEGYDVMKEVVVNTNLTTRQIYISSITNGLDKAIEGGYITEENKQEILAELENCETGSVDWDADYKVYSKRENNENGTTGRYGVVVMGDPSYYVRTLPFEAEVIIAIQTIFSNQGGQLSYLARLIFLKNIIQSSPYSVSVFVYNSKVESIIGTIDISGATTGLNSYFLGCQNLHKFPKLINYQSGNNYASFFYLCKKLKVLDRNILDANLITHSSTASVSNGRSVFQGCTLLEEIDDISFKLVSYNGFFYGCCNLTKITSIIYFDYVKEATTNMFASCKSLTHIKLRNWSKYDISITASSLLSADSIKYIIWHAMNGANTLGYEDEGATSRTLTLQKATAHDVTWAGIKNITPSVEDCEMLGIDENEITKYGNLTWSQIASEVKLITITA